MSLEFYHHTEKQAVEQISVRVSEGGGDWQGWSSNDIIHPERHRYHFNQNNILSHFGFGRRNPHDKLYEPLNEFEIFMKFKELLREFDPFIVIDNFDGTTFSNNGPRRHPQHVRLHRRRRRPKLIPRKKPVEASAEVVIQTFFIRRFRR